MKYLAQCNAMQYNAMQCNAGIFKFSRLFWIPFALKERVTIDQNGVEHFGKNGYRELVEQIM